MMTKNHTDEVAYEFLHGYFSAINVQVKEENIYNNIDGLGAMIFLPIETVMNETASKSQLSTKVLKAIHVANTYFVGSSADLLVSNKVLTTTELASVRKIAKC